MGRQLKILLVAILAGLVCPQLAVGKKEAPPTLTGELLESEAQISFSCPMAGRPEGRLEYTASGLAIGPFPGPYTESGTIVGDRFGQVQHFEATFTIDSPFGLVVGTKLGPALPSTMSCRNIDPVASSTVFARYVATIQTSAGIFRDEGTTTTHVSGAPAPGPAEMSEEFASDLPEPILVCARFKEHPNDPEKNRCKDK